MRDPAKGINMDGVPNLITQNGSVRTKRSLGLGMSRDCTGDNLVVLGMNSPPVLVQPV